MKFNVPTIMLIVAPTCSGKSFLLEELVKEKLVTRVVGTTTRQPRADEVSGVHYHFLSPSEFDKAYTRGEFTQTVEFGGHRYGVTRQALNAAALQGAAPAIIVEPSGVAEYRRWTSGNNWRIFTVFVHLQQKLCISRLAQRTLKDLEKAHDDATKLKTLEVMAERVRSITSEESGWIAKCAWNVVVPGDDVVGAVAMIKSGIYQANRKIDGGLI